MSSIQPPLLSFLSFYFRNDHDIKEKSDYIVMAGHSSTSKAGTESEILPVHELTLTPSSIMKPSLMAPLDFPPNTSTDYAWVFCLDCYIQRTTEYFSVPSPSIGDLIHFLFFFWIINFCLNFAGKRWLYPLAQSWAPKLGQHNTHLLIRRTGLPHQTLWGKGHVSGNLT